MFKQLHTTACQIVCHPVRNLLNEITFLRTRGLGIIRHHHVRMRRRRIDPRGRCVSGREQEFVDREHQSRRTGEKRALVRGKGGHRRWRQPNRNPMSLTHVQHTRPDSAM